MAKKLHKKYRSLPTDLEEFKNEIEKNPFQGAELTPGIRNIHLHQLSWLQALSQ